MRPQPLGCGNHMALAKSRSDFQPSMRPQPLGCGNTDRQGCESIRDQSFNEAATVRLRKYHRVVRLCWSGMLPSMRPQPLGCGNLVGIRSGENPRRPSMRPQPLGCGNLNKTQLGIPPSRSFNEAATVRLRKYCHTKHTLACLLAPSMRPQPLGCGNYGT